MSVFGNDSAGISVPTKWRDRAVTAWVPAKTCDRDFSLTQSEVRATEQASAALRDSDARIPETWEALARLLLRHEGIASSGIEGLREPLVSVLIAERTGAGGVAGWVADNLAVIRMALDAAHGSLDTETLHCWHERLMRNSDLTADLMGAFRPSVGWVGGNSPLDAAYVPPPPDLIPELMDDLVRFADSTDAGLDPITHAAVLHAQFELIHPYGDGNGRLGRILISRALRRANLAVRSTVPISVAIARDPGGYLSGLKLYELGKVGPWVEWFSRVARDAADTTNHLARRTVEISDEWDRKLEGVRAGSAARALIPLLPGNPVMSAQDVKTLLDVSQPAARAALLTLADREIMTAVQARAPGAGRNRNWFAATDLINTWA
ncbi:Fic family protein [Candidatus Poriferisodalis sp.]|uniref:Fic family protein n=1 Tax=Candidatus Poriferisodalis sp. TaxID=3101277 RepID=UPI003C6EA8CB